jgi:hypothetical protein
MTTSVKPVVKGPIDGNIFSVVAACSTAMKRAGISKDKIDELHNLVVNADNYHHALRICVKYVDFDFTNEDNYDDDEDDA